MRTDNKQLMDEIFGEGIVPSKNVNLITITGDDPEETRFLVLLKILKDDEEDEFEWFVTKGRQATYNLLKQRIQYEPIFVHESYVIDEHESLKDSSSVYQFMKIMSEGKYVIDDGSFDIYAYVDEDNNEDPLQLLETWIDPKSGLIIVEEE